MPWTIHLEPEVRDWLHELRTTDRESLKEISAAIDILRDQGPTAGRPLVDKIKYSSVHNLKELRPGSAGSTEIRMLFAFDEERKAVFLVAGNKEGNWKEWYKISVALAEERFERYCARLAGDADRASGNERRRDH